MGLSIDVYRPFLDETVTITPNISYSRAAVFFADLERALEQETLVPPESCPLITTSSCDAVFQAREVSHFAIPFAQIAIQWLFADPGHYRGRLLLRLASALADMSDGDELHFC